MNEIKKVEPSVTHLQVELEKIHSKTTMNTKQLHLVNENFDRFMQKWSMVVSKISDALNVLTNSVIIFFGTLWRRRFGVKNFNNF